MNILLTGGHGFLGGELVKQCQNFGFTPIILIRGDLAKSKFIDNDRVCKIAYSSLKDDLVIASLKRLNPVCFIHVGWKGIDGTMRNDRDQIEYNLPYSLDTVRLADKVGCKQWIGIGSLSEYGVLNQKIDENYRPDPVTMYAKSKLATCWSTSALCQSLNIKWSWIRVGSMFGPGDGDKWLIPYVINSLMNNVIPKLTLSEQLWDYLYIEDAAKAVLSIFKEGAEGIYNLGSGRSYSIKSVVAEITSQMKSGILPDFGALPYHPQQTMHMEADISKIINATGWKPRFSLSDGLRETINHLRSV